MSFIQFLAASTEVKEKFGAEHAIIVEYWNTVVTKKPMEELVDQIKVCRAKKTKPKGKGKEQIKIQLAMAGNHNGAVKLEEAIKIVMAGLGGATRKVGPAPRGVLEREASRLLGKL